MTALPALSYLIVNTNQRELLLACLDSVFSTAPNFAHEVIVLDNCSVDGSVEAVRQRYGNRVNLIELARRTGKAENDTRLLEASRGRFALLLNEDTELCPGAVEHLLSALEAHPLAAIAGPRILKPDATAQPSAWRFPGLATAGMGALFLHRLYTEQSKGNSLRQVDWVQSAAMMVRRAAFEQVGGLDSRFFVYSDEVDWQKRIHGAGWSVLFVPQARVIHHEMLGGKFSEPRIVEFARNRDRYMRKHHGRVTAFAVRVLTAWAYAVRAAAAVLLPRHDPRRYWLHARMSLIPSHGIGLRELAEKFNQRQRWG